MIDRGFSVFPLHPFDHEDYKDPFPGFMWTVDATRSKARVTTWFGPGGRYQKCGYGVPMGPEWGVFDADVKNGQPGLASFDLVQQMGDIDFSLIGATPSGGRHGYFKTDGESAGNSMAGVKDLYPGVDIKSGNGYVVGPGCIRADGKGYVLLDDNPSAKGAAPDFLRRLRSGAPKVRVAQGKEPALPLDLPESIEMAIRYLKDDAPESIQGSGDGGGGKVLFAVAAELKDLGISEPLANELIGEHYNETKAHPPWDPDEAAEKIGNAYKYAKNRPGSKNPLAEFDAVDDIDLEKPSAYDAPPPAETPVAPAAPAAPKNRLYRVGFDAAANMATTQDNPVLIEDVIDQNSFAVVYGPSNSGKTFLGLSWSYHIAAGVQWHGKEVEQGAVLYVVLEGGKGINKRLGALRQHYAPATHIPLDIVPCPVDMRSSDADTRKVVKLIEESEAEHKQPVRLVVIDTLSRALAGGDENGGEDMGAFVMNVDKLRAATSAAVLVVHHSGKNVANGARGWSGLRAAIDSEIEIGAGNSISFVKQRDMEMIPDIRFRLVTLELGVDSRGRKITSCVLETITEAEAEFEDGETLSPMAREYFECLVGTMKKDAWDAAFDEANGSPVGIKTKQGLRSQLIEIGWVTRVQNNRFQATKSEMQ